jgi:hypothetical protein
MSNEKLFGLLVIAQLFFLWLNFAILAQRINRLEGKDENED